MGYWKRASALLSSLLAAVLVLPLAAYANGPEGSVGVVDTTTGIWYLRDAASGETTSFFYGNPGDFPVLGDWDCDGDETPGLYRQSDGFVYLRNSNTQGVADIRFFFGNPGDIPIVGDFNADGCDTVSIYRPSEGRVYIINKLGANEGGLGAADFAYFFGNPGDKPFVGDFDNDGIDEVGLHRESTGLVYFRYTHTEGVADESFIYGDPGDKIIAANWAQSGALGPDTVGIFRPSNGIVYLRFSNTQGVADAQFQYGNANMLPVAGNFGPLPGGDLPPPPPFVSGWLPNWTMTSSLRAVTDHPHLFRAASPFWYTTRSAARIDLRAGAEDPGVVDALKQAGVPVIPTVIAPLSPQVMHDFLIDPDARRTHIAALVDLVVSRGYDGIDLNYEHFAVTDDPELIEANRDGFSALVSELCPALRDRGRLCVVTVMARTDDRLHASYRSELGVGVYDYEALGAAVDRLRVMTYDHHYPTGPPGPVAGYSWVEDVIRYTVARVPAGKVELGVASYGYDWGSPGTLARARTTVEMQSLAASLGVRPEWSETEQERTFSYRSSGIDRIVWFQDARALRERVLLAAEYCLTGVAMWTTGGADRAMWETLEQLAVKMTRVGCSTVSQ